MGGKKGISVGEKINQILVINKNCKWFSNQGNTFGTKKCGAG